LGQAVEIVEIATKGDVEQGAAIATFSATGVFTKEIQRALLAGEVDVAVHSMKDLPTEKVAGLFLGAVPPRESPFDVVVAGSRELATASLRQGATSLEQIPAGARIGTGSLRRQAQLRHVRPDFRISEIRGNVDTRLRKLDEGEFDAIVLARAGLVRLGFEHRISFELMPPTMLPAVGQGALAIECREEDARTRELLMALDDAETLASVLAERAVLARLRGGCLAPIGAWGRVREGARFFLSAVVLSGDGKTRLAADHVGEFKDASSAEHVGERVADSLLEQGAADLIAGSRQADARDDQQ
jgi:hydroxymethylbilane synthase